MYSFRDTVETGAAEQLPSEALSLDYVYIEDKIPGYRTLSVSGRESLEYQVTDADRAFGNDGMEYYGKRQQGRTLTVRFQLLAEDATQFFQQYVQLKAFCTGENRHLRFRDMANHHYVGTLVSISEPEPGRITGVGEMQFYCADPHMITDLWGKVTASRVNGVLTAKVDVTCTGKVYPQYEILHNGENGYVGIVHAGGALEAGNREEADTETIKSELLLKENVVSGFSRYTGTNPWSNTIATAGTITADSSGYFTLTNAGTNNGGWHGGCMKWNLPADSKGVVGATHCYLWFMIDFMTSQMGQSGQTIVMLADASNKMVAGFSIHKSDMTGNQAFARILVGGNNPREVERWYFTPSTADAENPFNGRGCEDILKEGKKITFFYWGKYYSVSVPELADVKVTSVIVSMAQYNTRNLTTQYIGRNMVRSMKFRKDNVNSKRDIPNRYAPNSRIVVDTAKSAVSLDGLPANDELVTGSVFAPLSPGQHTIEFYPSTWCSPAPEITVWYEERWL